jgi:transcriptional regulator with XRE-family HTH domain
VHRRVNTQRLQVEMTRRGITALDLAREAKVSAPTVRAALSGRAIRVASLGCIAGALARIAVIEGVDALLVGTDEMTA